MESDKTMLEIAFGNLLEEFREVIQQQAVILKALSDIKQRIEDFEQKLTCLKIATSPINTVPLTHTINQGIEKIKSTIEEQPKSIIRQFRILLFPEYGASEYYKLVFGRILFWLFLILSATYLYALGKHYIEVTAIEREIKLENNNIRKPGNICINIMGKR